MTLTKGHSSYGADMNLHLKLSRWNNSESMKAKVVILVCDTLLWPVLHSCEVPWLYSKGYSINRMDTKLHLEWSRGNNSESMKVRVAILVHDLFYITVKYHDYIPNGFQVMERTRNCIWNHQGEITQKVWKRKLSFLYATHLHNFEVSWLYSKGYSSYTADANMHKKNQTGDNSKSVKVRAPIFVRDTSSWPVLHNCEVSSKYSSLFSSYRAEMKRTDARLIAISPIPFGLGIKLAFIVRWLLL